MSAIGKYFNSLASGWNQPGFWSGELQDYTYVQDAAEWMTDAELRTGLDAVNVRLEFFQSISPRNEDERNNLNTVIGGYKRKKLQYENMILKRAAPTVIDNPLPVPTDDGSTGTDNNTPAKPNYMPYIIGGAVLIYFIVNKNKKR